MLSFGNILGNEHVLKILQNAVSHGNPSHAYILDGAPGMGKKLISEVFAKALQCEHAGDKPCNLCASCRGVNSGNHPDIIYIRPAKTKSLGVSDVREQISRQTDTGPYKYKHKIFIIEDAHQMTTQAQNALLKTLEEPPGFAVFLLLTTATNTLLPTVLSRAVVLNLRPLPQHVVKAYLTQNLYIEDATASFFSTYAQGNIGLAQQISQSESFAQMRNDTLAIVENIENGGIKHVIQSAAKLELYKNDISICLKLLSLFYRDVLAYKTCGQAHVLQQDKLTLITTKAETLPVEKLHKNINAIEHAHSNLAANANFGLAIEIMLLSLQ